jgi:hypothetical protein
MSGEDGRDSTTEAIVLRIECDLWAFGFADYCSEPVCGEQTIHKQSYRVVFPGDANLS